MSFLGKAVFGHHLPVCWEELPSQFGRPVHHGGQNPICYFKLMTVSWCSRQLLRFPHFEALIILQK